MHILNEGNKSRLIAAMEKAKRGEQVTVGYLGGSITQGSLSSTPETCYAYLSWLWWKKNFPNTEFTYVNAGIGGTTSHFGGARVEEDLLYARPDVVFVEFSVNDDNEAHFQETYEGLIRHILSASWQPAVILLHNIFYDDGRSAKEIHSEVGRHYDLPSISFGDVLWPMIQKGELQVEKITPDNLHPNDQGHKMLADMVSSFLDKVKQESAQGKAASETQVQTAMPEAITVNRYENAKRFRNKDISPVCMKGFVADEEEQKVITDTFKKGWMATEQGADITFKVTASCIALQYRKTIQHPAPKAIVYLDGKENESILLDADFEETWGDCLYLQIVCEGNHKTEHEVTVKLVKTTKEDVLPFYLVSLLTD